MSERLVKWLWRRIDMTITFWFIVYAFWHGHETAGLIILVLMFLESIGIHQQEKIDWPEYK